MRDYMIMLVDDDPLILKGVGKHLETEGYGVTTAESGEKAIDLLDSKVFDLVITDLVMEEIDGIQVLKKAKEVNPDIMVIILTGFGDMTSAVDSLRLQADDYLHKPCEAEEMSFRVSKCFERLELKRKIKAYENILPVCCVCKKIRDDSGKEPGTGEWLTVESYLWRKAGIAPSSSYCPVCLQKETEKMADDI